MPVDAIGGVINAQDTNVTRNNSINQEDFIRLFLTQLQFQDPLEPVDNREFLAQLAQFTSLEQSRQTSQNTTDLLGMTANSQAIALLGKQVDVRGLSTPFTGAVIGVQFDANGAQLTIRASNNEVRTNVRLSQVTLIKP